MRIQKVLPFHESKFITQIKLIVEKRYQHYQTLIIHYDVHALYVLYVAVEGVIKGINVHQHFKGT